MPRRSRIFSAGRLEVWAVALPSRDHQHSLTHALLDAVRGDRSHWSISHTRGLGLVAVADRPVGIDVEALRERPRLARAVSRLAPEAAGIADPRELYALWCAHEAWAKAHRVPLWRSRGATIAAEPIDAGPGYVAALVRL